MFLLCVWLFGCSVVCSVGWLRVRVCVVGCVPVCVVCLRLCMFDCACACLFVCLFVCFLVCAFALRACLVD